MVVRIKYILISIVAICIAIFGVKIYFDTKINTQMTELATKQEIVGRYELLNKRWCKKTQMGELKRVKDFLSAFDVKYQIKELKKSKEIQMVLKQNNLDKVVEFILNRNLRFKSFSLKKTGRYTIDFKVVVL